MTLTVRATVPERDVEIDIEVGDGEVVALLGPNGAGKSTALGVVAGLVRPRTGLVTLGERRLVDVAQGRTRTWVPPHDRHVALLSQDPLLFPHLTVEQNVAFGPRSRGLSRTEALEAASRWLDEVDAGHLAARRPSDISGGQAQRVAVARALAAEPEVLLLDEPMAALDVAVAPALRQMLTRVLRGRNALVVTHDPLDALLLAQRVVVIENGRVVEEGPSQHVLTRPRSGFAARIAGLNMLTGHWHDGHMLTDDGFDLQGPPVEVAPATGEPVAAVFRPTSVAVFAHPPGGSIRNVLPVTVSDLEPRGDRVRVHAGTLTAEVTVQAAAELNLVAGDQVHFAVKATDVVVYSF